MTHLDIIGIQWHAVQYSSLCCFINQ